MIIGSIISSIIGVGVSFAQDKLKDRQDERAKRLELEIWQTKEKHDLKMQHQKQELQIQDKELSLEAMVIQNKNTIATSEAEVDKSFFDNAAKTSMAIPANDKLTLVSNFIVSTTRPVISYMLIICIIALTFNLVHHSVILQDLPVWFQDYIASILYFTDGIMSYWFIRRSSEKNNSMNSFLKNGNFKKKI